MRRRLLLVVALLGRTLGGGAGCSQCSVDCAPDQELRFTGTLVAVDERATTWDSLDGQVDVQVTTNVDFLDVGERYQVTAHEGTGPLDWQTSINEDCSCSGNIRHANGEMIDTAWWAGVERSTPVTEAVWLVLAIPAVTIVAVTAMRMRRGGEYDPWGEGPDDES